MLKMYQIYIVCNINKYANGYDGAVHALVLTDIY